MDFVTTADFFPPVRLFVIGDFGGERTSIDEAAFDETFSRMAPGGLRSLGQFQPDSIAQRDPDTRELVRDRRSLVAIKTPLGSFPECRKKIESVLREAPDRLLMPGTLDETMILPQEPRIHRGGRRGRGASPGTD